MIERLTTAVHQLGTLRSMLAMLSIILIVLTPFSDTALPPEGWGLLFGAVLPAASPMVFMVVMLDFLMSFILKTDVGAIERHRYHFIIKTDLVLAILLMLTWLPIFLKAV